MKKFSKNKIALFLACASVLGGKTQAMNISKVQIPQVIGTVGGARTKPKKINWGKIVKIGGFSVAGLVTLEAIHSIIGATTNSKLGRYSIGSVIKERIEKKNQADEEKQTRDKIKKFVDDFCKSIFEKIGKVENCDDIIDQLLKDEDKDLTKILNKISFIYLTPKFQTKALSSEEIKNKELVNNIGALKELLNFSFMIDSFADTETSVLKVKIEYTTGNTIKIIAGNDEINFHINDDNDKLFMTVTQNNKKHMATFRRN